MAFTNFYLVAGGVGSADINSGFSVGAAKGTATNGNWSTVTGVFVAPSGTPFATTVVGDYASVYVDGATIAVFVAKVLTVTSSVNITIDVATLKYGTAPTTSATGRSCTINGSWNTELPLAATGLGTTTVPQSTKINIKGNLSIGASRTISMAGATTTPLWFSGYNTAPGDLDADTTNGLAKPIWTLNAGVGITASGTYQTWSGVSMVGNASGSIWLLNGTMGTIVRCRCENTSSNAAAISLHVGNFGATIAYTYLKTPSTATTTGVCDSNSTATWIGVIADTGGKAGWNIGSSSSRFINCIGVNNVGASILASTGTVFAINCTFYGATVDGIKWTGTPSQGNNAVIGCLFSGLNGSTATTNGINNASGTNTSNIVRACNDYYNVTNPEVGFGDFPPFFGQTDSGPVVLSATNMTPSRISNAANHGFPGIFENQAYTSSLNIGSVEQAPGFAGFFIQ